MAPRYSSCFADRGLLRGGDNGLYAHDAKRPVTAAEDGCWTLDANALMLQRSGEGGRPPAAQLVLAAAEQAR
jgi:hypothetical protein